MAVLSAIGHCFAVPMRFLKTIKLGTWYERRREKLVVFTFYGHFVGYCTLFWVPRRFQRPMKLADRLRGDVKNSLFSRMMAVLSAIAHCFGVPGQFLKPMKLGTWFVRRRQKLVVFAFYGRFMGYCTLFWGPVAIS
jgi:hypothetical protein